LGDAAENERPAALRHGIGYHNVAPRSNICDCDTLSSVWVFMTGWTPNPRLDALPARIIKISSNFHILWDREFPTTI
jgi:hypothetical protein